MAVFILITVSVMHSLRFLLFYFESKTLNTRRTVVVDRRSLVYNDKINWKKEGF